MVSGTPEKLVKRTFKNANRIEGAQLLSILARFLGGNLQLGWKLLSLASPTGTCNSLISKGNSFVGLP